MNNATLAVGMRIHAALEMSRRARAKAVERLQDETGEIGSWLVFVALLAVTAVAVAGIVDTWLKDKANALP